LKLITSNEEISSTLVELIEVHEKIQFAVAWATDENSVYKVLKKNKSKIRKSVIGMDGYITKPNVLSEFTNNKKVKFATSQTGTFHPKIYLFKTNNEWDLIIGSANMTSGGFCKNTEIMMHVSSNDSKKNLFKESRSVIDGYWSEAETMTSMKAEDYLGLYLTHRSKNPHLNRKTKKGKAHINTTILPMSWDKFYKKVTAVKRHTIEDRFDLLDAVRWSFDKYPSMYDMSREERRMIAGLRNDLNSYTGLFGSMDRAAYTHHWQDHIDGNNKFLSAALDLIPSLGTIDKSSFQNYSAAFQEATGYQNAVGTFTRLLAMKRPDTFVCLTNTNKQALCRDFGISMSTLTYEKYWDEIVDRLTQSVWWNAPQPKEASNLKVWNSRSALLDAIYYNP